MGSDQIFAVEGLDHVAIEVSDLDGSAEWYSTALAMSARERYRDETGRGRPIVMCNGSGCIALFPAGGSAPPLRGHIAFRLDRGNFARARAHLDTVGIEQDYVEYDKVHSTYIRDPDGYLIELSTWEI